MHKRLISVFAVGFGAAILAAGNAHPPVGFAVPNSLEVSFWIHDDPSDPESDVTFKIKLALTESDSDGDSIGWDVTSIEFRQIHASGPDTVWVESSPSVPTGDGLWWVTHADPTDPQTDEFVMPPNLSGTAVAQDSKDDDLDYDFEGVTYTPPPPPGEPPYEVTAGMDYYFALALWPPIIIITDDDVPVEVPPIERPPIGS